MLARATTFCLSLTDSSLLFLHGPKKSTVSKNTLIKPAQIRCYSDFKCLPIEQHISLCILHDRLVDLCDILVVKLIPLAIDHILTVSYVVSTCSIIDSGREEVSVEKERRPVKMKTRLRFLVFWNRLTARKHQKCSYLMEIKWSHTSCRAVMTNDWQQIIGGDLGWTLFSQERSHVQALQWEGYVAADLERIHDFVPEAFQVNAQNLHDKTLHDAQSISKHCYLKQDGDQIRKMFTSGSLRTLQYLTPFLNL